MDRGIAEPESVADHSYRNAMMAWVFGDAAGLDTGRLVKLMLVHDLAEAEVGDATPYDEILRQGVDPADAVARWRDLVSDEDLARAREKKHRLEAQAMRRLADDLPAGLAGEILELWTEYAERRSPEARFAAQIDKLEALLQALEYRDAGEPADVENFLLSAREAVRHPVLVDLLQGLESAMASDRS